MAPSFMASNRFSLGTMWLSSISLSFSWLIWLSSKSKNATFLGAKTVKEPSPLRVSHKPAFCTDFPNCFSEKEGWTNAASRILKDRYDIQFYKRTNTLNPNKFLRNHS